MGKRSRGKNRQRKQKAQPKPPPPQTSIPTQSVKKEIRVLEMLGLLLTALGLISLIGLRPRASVSSSPPTDSDDWLRSQFTVTNDGYLQLNDVHAICFIWRAKTGSAEITDDAVRAAGPANPNLPPGQSFTVPCERSQSFSSPYRSIDLAVVLAYRPWPFTFIRQRQFFRFVARLDNETVTWDRQPSAALEHEFDLLLSVNPQLADFK